MSREDETIKVGVPAPSGDGEMHIMKGDLGIPVPEDTTITTNRLYLTHESDGLELTAEEARRLAGVLRTAADALQDHHDVRMPVDEE